jgi:predicted amidohydrolase
MFGAVRRGGTMSDPLAKYVAAAVQAAPVFLDRDATVDKACELIRDAGKAGASLIVFPETWIPMYPFWHSTPGVFSGDLFARMYKNSVEVPSRASDQIAAAAKDAGAYVVMGVNERDIETRGTLYNSMLWFSPRGDLLHRHRKLMPSFTERTIWGMGDGSDLTVLDTPLGRLGGLICWEHEMTLVKAALYAQGEQVHCSQWPAYSFQNDHIGFGTRQYAFEGACFVVSSCGVVPKGKMPKEIAERPVPANGGSAIIAPDGSYLEGPIYDKEEIIYAEVDLERAIREKHSHDVAGHYARPDVLQLVVNTRPRRNMTFVEHEAGNADGKRAAANGAVIDRLQAVRAYLSSLIDRAGADGDREMNEALAEALASIDMAAAGVWANE